MPTKEEEEEDDDDDDDVGRLIISDDDNYDDDNNWWLHLGGGRNARPKLKSNLQQPQRNNLWHIITPTQCQMKEDSNEEERPKENINAKFDYILIIQFIYIAPAHTSICLL